jgi:hypothetical protein
MALYSDSLGLPYIQEDSFHIRWLANRTIPDIWLSAQGAPAYRPLGKTIVKFWFLVLGHHDRAWLRFQNICLHTLNVSLTGLLAVLFSSGRRRYWTGGAAALLFAALPFSYQAVPWINNFFYPLGSFLLLSMTVVYWRARVRSSRQLLAVALFLCLLAPFEIEYGAVGSGLLLLVEVVLWLQRRQARPWLRGPALGLLMNVAFVLRWMTVPKVSYTFGPPTPERVIQIGTYYLQGIAFPASPLGRFFMDQFGFNDLLAVAVVGLPWLVLVAVLLARTGQLPLFLSGLLWFGLLALPTLVAVDFDYVINSPRLIYPPGPAAAWLSAGCVATLLCAQRGRVISRAVGILVLLLAVFYGVPFVRERIRFYHLVGRPVEQLAETCVEESDERSLLIVNFPSWLAPPKRTFALGNHGVQLIPDYVALADLVYAMTATEQNVRPVQFAPVREQQPYYYGLLGEQLDYERLRTALVESADVYLTQYAPSQIDLVWAGRTSPASNLAPTAIFGDRLELQVDRHEINSTQVQLALVWFVQSPVDQDWTVFFHIYNSSGALVAQDDGYPLRGLAPFWLWSAGQALVDNRLATLGDATAPGTYLVGVGVYDRATGERIPATSPSGVRLADDTVPVAEVQVR